MPDVSVIIPTFRRPAKLAHAIESVIAQREVVAEVLVVDDCPDGSAKAVASRFGESGVVYRRSPTSSGGRPAVVRNFGSTFATADIVHFLDDDDVVPDGYYGSAKAAFQQHPNVGVVFGSILPFGADNVASEKLYFKTAKNRARIISRLGTRFALSATLFFGPTLLVCSAAMIRRRCIQPLGGFNTKLPLMEDVDFYARAIRQFGALVLDDISINYRIGDSLMRQPDRLRLITRSYSAIQAAYFAEHGIVDYLAMKLLARLLERLPC